MKTTVETWILEPPTEMEFGSKNQEFGKSKVASTHTWFTVVLFHKNQEGRQQWHGTLAKGTAKFINVLRHELQKYN